MKLISVNGREQYKNCNAYRIDWKGKSRSKYQKRVKDFLAAYWQKNVVFEEFPVFGSRMTLDFYNMTKGVAIEMQGEGHTKYSEFFHGNPSGYHRQHKRDREKEKFCISNDIMYIEIFPEDIGQLSEMFFRDKLGVKL